MDNMKIRYVLKNKENIIIRIYTLSEIENGILESYLKYEWTIISRDLFTGKQDATRTEEFPNGKDIFENDICTFKNSTTKEQYKSIVIFNVEGFSFKVVLDEYGTTYCPNITSSFIEDIETLGNTWQNPEYWRCNHDA